MHHSNYHGMRWMKCDLQMQTPADAQHWQGEQFDLDKTNMTKLADDYARACYEAELDVIGITDHNFLSKGFIPELRAALDRLESEYGRHITLFPGFEFEADVGKGIHVLCLFEPDTDLDSIDHSLTDCGVAHPRVRNGVLEKSTKRLPEILNIIQRARVDGKWRGIVIVPHVFEVSLFDNDRISEWLQQEEYLNPDLLVVEVPKPVHRMNPNFQKLFKSDDDCLPEWKRERPIATIMSSDNKMLRHADGEGRPVANSIGYRYTWIKMSEPSIESLRQAFLDHDSRIILPDDVVADIHPEMREKHARLLSMTISGAAFLEDQEIHLSPNLNCIIGGRGTGKSTILEGIRIALGKDKNFTRDDDPTKRKVNRIQRLLNRNPGTELKIRWQTSPSVEDVIKYTVSDENKGSRSIEREETPDIGIFLENLPIQIFSQQQLNQITDRDGNMLLSLLDSYIYDDLQRLEQQEERSRNEIRRLFTVKRQLEQIQAEIRRFKQEIDQLERQLSTLNELREDFDNYQKLKAAGEYIQSVRTSVDTDGDALIQSVEALVEEHDPPTATDQEWQDAEWFDEKDKEFLSAKLALRALVQDAVKKYRASVESLYFMDARWAAISSAIEGADEEFKQIFADKGVDPDDITRIQEISEKLRDRRTSLSEKQEEQRTFEESLSNLSAQFELLHDTWFQSYQIRESIASEIEAKVPTIKLEVEYSVERGSFLTAWKGLANDLDGRSSLGKAWEDIGSTFLEDFAALVDNEDTNYKSPWELIEAYLEESEPLSQGLQALFNGTNRISFDDVRQKLRDDLRDGWETVRTLRVEDTVDLVLYRNPHGDEAGRISNDSLSDGQRNTAALMIILAKGETPLVFDQPEDELDSGFVFDHLVPMLRDMKSKRQIIVVTHNANLPVNADAELIYALETRDNVGILRTCGALDQVHVMKAVLDIMEGSETAFKRRREKYHF